MFKKLVAILLFPLSALYWLITTIRNTLYDRKIIAHYSSNKLTINIGNLTVGGTGKTPQVEYLTRLLQKKHQLAILSRGYGRKTKGLVAASERSTALEIGDEPLQYYQKFQSKIPVFVCEKRAVGLQEIEKRLPKLDIVLLDDAFQHRSIKPTLNILLTDYKRPFYDDFLLPSGRLRESRKGAERADAVIVSKCLPELSEEEREQIISKIKKFTNTDCPLFFSMIQYGSPLPYFAKQTEFDKHKNIVLLSGIAQPALFEQAARKHFSVADHLIFKDHHVFSRQDVEKLVSKVVLTTEKDFVKIRPLLAAHSQFYYWPIEVKFLENQQIKFDEWMEEQIKQKTKF